MHTNLTGMIKSLILLFGSAWDVNHPFVWRILPVSCLVATSVIISTVPGSQCLCLSRPYFTH